MHGHQTERSQNSPSNQNSNLAELYVPVNWGQNPSEVTENQCCSTRLGAGGDYCYCAVHIGRVELAMIAEGSGRGEGYWIR